MSAKDSSRYNNSLSGGLKYARDILAENPTVKRKDLIKILGKKAEEKRFSGDEE